MFHIYIRHCWWQWRAHCSALILSIYVIRFRSVLFVYRKSTSPSDYQIILIRSSRDESEANLSLTTESASSVGTLVNKLTTSKLTMWLDRMGASLIISTKWDEFWLYEGDFLINGSIISTRKRLREWHTEPWQLIIDLSGIPSLWRWQQLWDENPKTSSVK